MLRSVSGLIFAFLLISTLTLAFNFGLVHTQAETVYINGDRSIPPSRVREANPFEIVASQTYPVYNLNTGLNYTTIQDAIDANQTLDGQTIEVDAGTYYETAIINKSITLVGEGSSATIIDGNGTGLPLGGGFPYEGSGSTIILIEASGVSILNLTVRNAGQYFEPGDGFDACVACYGENDIDIENNVFLNAGKTVILGSDSFANVSNNDFSDISGMAIDVGYLNRNITVSNNVIHDSGYCGINFDGDDEYCEIMNNTVENGYRGIELAPNVETGVTPDNVTLSNNFVHDYSSVGILPDGTYCNIVNNTVQNGAVGIGLVAGTYCCNIINNTVETGSVGIYLEGAPFDNLIDGNILSNNNDTNILCAGATTVAQLQASYTNTFRGNNLTNVQHHNLMVWGDNLASFMQDIDSSNTANNKKIYYLTNSSNLEVDPSSFPDAGSLTLVNCTDTTVKDFDFSRNNDGLLMAGCTDCTLTNVTLANNQLYDLNQSYPSIYGSLTLFDSSHNTIVDSRICNNTCGIWLCSSDWNTFYQNAFIDNDRQVISNIDSPFVGQTASSGITSICAWNNTVEGNYWSNYNGTDLYSGQYQNVTGSDGIGDTPYVIDANNRDNYPLMGMFSVFNVAVGVDVQVVSNSTISDFQFNGTAILFNVTGANGTTGFCNICVPTSLLNGTLIVIVNGTQVKYSLLPISNGSNSYLYFTYGHSTEQVTILPEFPSLFILTLFMMATLVAVVICKKKGLKTS
jgi:parallel beta-helix repeat protein